MTRIFSNTGNDFGSCFGNNLARVIDDFTNLPTRYTTCDTANKPSNGCTDWTKYGTNRCAQSGPLRCTSNSHCRGYSGVTDGIERFLSSQFTFAQFIKYLCILYAHADDIGN